LPKSPRPSGVPLVIEEPSSSTRFSPPSIATGAMIGGRPDGGEIVVIEGEKTMLFASWAAFASSIAARSVQGGDGLNGSPQIPSPGSGSGWSAVLLTVKVGAFGYWAREVVAGPRRTSRRTRPAA